MQIKYFCNQYGASVFPVGELASFMMSTKTDLEFILFNLTSLGFIDYDVDRQLVTVKDKLYNSAAVTNNQEMVDTYQKVHLPNYGVFDEKRYFEEGSNFPVYDLNGVRFGINVCEDIWFSSGPTNVQSNNGASLIININGSPFNLGKRKERENVLIERSRDNGVYIAYINMVGGQDELVFDGGSLVVGPTGNILMRADQFKEHLYIYDFELPKY